MMPFKAGIVLIASNGAAARHPDHDGQIHAGLGVFGCPDIEAERTVAANHAALGVGLQRNCARESAVERVFKRFDGNRRKEAPFGQIGVLNERDALIELNAVIDSTLPSETPGGGFRVSKGF